MKKPKTIAVRVDNLVEMAVDAIAEFERRQTPEDRDRVYELLRMICRIIPLSRGDYYLRGQAQVFRQIKNAVSPAAAQVFGIYLSEENLTGWEKASWKQEEEEILSRRAERQAKEQSITPLT